MDYPITRALVDYILDGCRRSAKGDKELEDKIAAAIATLPPHARQALSTADIFANAALSIPTSRDLRKMTANPAFKVEATISQLRRAESRYIEAHDEYLADRTNGLRIEAMRWAHGRLSIVRQFYDGVIASLPSKEREDVVAHPVIRRSTATKDLRLSSFSAEEQRALRLAITDRESAIGRIDEIIAEGRASSNDLQIIHAYLIDPRATNQVERWLVDQLAAIRSTADGAASTAVTIPEKVVEPGTSHDVSGAAPDVSMTSAGLPQRDGTLGANQAEERPAPAVVRAIDVIDSWLSKSPRMLDYFNEANGWWRFNGEIKTPDYAAAYQLAGTHPDFQRMIARHKTERDAINATLGGQS